MSKATSEAEEIIQINTASISDVSGKSFDYVVVGS